MAQISRTVAGLRIGGDDLIPSEITSLLGCEPSSEQTKGEVIVRKGHKRIA